MPTRQLILLSVLTSLTLLEHARAQNTSINPNSAQQRQVEPAQNTRIRTTTLELPIFLDGKEVAMLRAQLKGLVLLGLHRTQLYTLLSARLTPEAMSKIAHLWVDKTEAWVQSEALEPAQITVQYDPAAVQLTLNMPLGIRRTSVHRLSERSAYSVEFSEPVSAAQKSFFINTRSSLQSATNQTNRTQTLQIDLNSAARLGPWVFESNLHSFNQTVQSANNSENTHTLQRGDLTVSRDFESVLGRFKIGDIYQRSVGSLPSQPMLGLSYEKLFNLNPQVTPFARPTQILSLPAGAAVDIYINGVLARSLRLEAGVHDLQQLPVNTGANEVSIRVTEPGRQSTWYKQSFFFDTQLLSKGSYDYQWVVGAPRINSATVTQTRSYSYDNMQLVTSHRYGVSDTTTLGAGARLGSASRQVFAELSTPLINGLWSNELTHLRHTDHYTGPSSTPAGQAASGWQLKSQWQWRALRSPRVGLNNPSISMQVSKRTGVYTDPLGLDNAQNEWGLRVSSNYSDEHTFSVSMRNLTYNDGYERNVYGTWTYRVNPRWTLDSVISHTKKERAHSTVNASSLGKSLLLTLRWNPSSDGLTAYGLVAGVDAYQNKRFLNYYYQGADSDGLWRLNAGSSYQGINANLNQLALTATQSLSNTSLQSLSTEYIHSRYEMQAQFERYHYTLNSVLPSSNVNERNQSIGLFFSNAFGYADGHWFTSRPIADSAAILSISNKLSDAGVYLVDPHPAAAKQDGWGAPVITPLTTAVAQSLVIDAERLGRGQNLGEDRFLIQPKYRSLSIIKVGVSAQTQLTGLLVNTQSKPVGLMPLLIQSLENNETFDVFTNRSGVFFSPALKTGQYQLTTSDGRLIHAFSITEDSPWKIDAQTLVLPQ